MPVCDDGPTLYFNATFSVDPNHEAASFVDFRPRRVSIGAQADAPFATSTGWFAVLVGRKPTKAFAETGPEDTGTMVMNRTVSVEFHTGLIPIQKLVLILLLQTKYVSLYQVPSLKVDPKVFFANERTFLAWLHVSVILAGASVAIVAFSDAQSTTQNQLYGVILLPISIAFVVYAMMQCKFVAFADLWYSTLAYSCTTIFVVNASLFFQCDVYSDSRRASMIRRQAPGPFVDVAGPILLSITLIVALVAQFSIRLSTLL
jgi:uncharacterized membrane protein YidH (DUF202 family)